MVSFYISGALIGFELSLIQRVRISEFGTVDSAKVIQDRDSGRSKGFGFVEMPNNDEARAAIEALNNSEIDGISKGQSDSLLLRKS